MFLCRLTPPLCLNFLGLIHMDSHITGLDDTDDKIDVEYTELMGHLDLGNIFKLYFLQSLHFIQFRMDSIYTFRF